MTKQDLSSTIDNIVIRRRPTTRKSGHISHPESTGGEAVTKNIPCYSLKQGNSISITFEIDDLGVAEDDLVGFGGWFYTNDSEGLEVSTVNVGKSRGIRINSGDWHAFGSLELKTYKNYFNISNPTFIFAATKDIEIAFYLLDCGIVEHEYMTQALDVKPVLLNNMYTFAPEANFIKHQGKVLMKNEALLSKELKVPLLLKSCNRCARFLPVNVPNERHSLSFSNHCIKNAPCVHHGFGVLKDVNTQERLDLHHGFQLECRFCKKFAVNAALNPQRNANQMKEDGARRRGFEVLLQDVFNGSPQLAYRAKNNNRELTSEVWNKFERKCFKCKCALPTMNKMHLDHTRPLALLWQLDETATCLCGSCNSQKRDRSPADFYTVDELAELSKITGIPLPDLQNSPVNVRAVEEIIKRMEWLMMDFCEEQRLNQIRDGKNTAELFLKALQKVFNQTPYGKDYDLIEIYRTYRGLKT